MPCHLPNCLASAPILSAQPEHMVDDQHAARGGIAVDVWQQKHAARCMRHANVSAQRTLITLCSILQVVSPAHSVSTNGSVADCVLMHSEPQRCNALGE